MPQSEIKMKMSLDGSGVKKTLNRTKASVQNFSKSGIAAIARFGAAFAGISAIKGMIGLATGAEETADKFNSVFGPSVDEMNKKIEKLKETIPATTRELQDAVAVFGLMAQSFGLNDEAAEGFSINMAKIAGDLASFHDIAPQEAFDKLRAGIAGSSEPLQSLGIDIREAALKQEALNMGIWDGVGVLSTSQKAMAVQSAVVSQMGAASGNAALTINSTSNTIKFMIRDLKEVATTIGNVALPAISNFAKGLDIISTGLGKVFKPDNRIDEVSNEFEEMARLQLKLRGELEKTSKSYSNFGRGAGMMVEDSEAVARNQAKISALAAEYAAKAEKIKKETGEVVANTGETSENEQAILNANTELLASIQEQIKAQKEFKTAQAKPKQIVGSKEKEKMGLDIERGEFEGRSEFLLRREKARGAQLKLNEAGRQVAAGGKTPDMAKIQELMSAAKGSGKDVAAETLETAKDSAELLKSINKGING